jgi:hypothetical protein
LSSGQGWRLASRPPVGGEPRHGGLEVGGGEMGQDVVRREEHLVGLHIHRHVAAGGAARPAGDLGPDRRRRLGVGPVELIQAPPHRRHQLVGGTQAAEARGHPGDGVVEQLEALVDREAGGHGSASVAGLPGIAMPIPAGRGSTGIVQSRSTIHAMSGRCRA